MDYKFHYNHDYQYSLMLGFISAIFLIAAENTFPFTRNIPMLPWVTLFAVPLLALIGISAAKVLFYKFHPAWQFSKFFLIGVTNTIVNFGTFDLLVHVSGLNTGVIVSFFGAISFTAAMVNSYIWNSHWAFHNKSPRSLNEFIKFFLVTFIGLLLSISIIFVIVNFIPAPKALAGDVWVNIANLIASFVVMFWSFYGYKYMVFEKQVKVHTLPTGMRPKVV